MSDTTTYKIVTLRLACDPRYDAPERWDWQTLIDATDPVTVLSVTDASGIESNQSKHVGEDGKLRYDADGSEVFPGATGVRPEDNEVAEWRRNLISAVWAALDATEGRDEFVRDQFENAIGAWTPEGD